MNIFRTGILIAGLTALFLLCGFLIGGESGMIIAFLLAMAMNGLELGQDCPANVRRA